MINWRNIQIINISRNIWHDSHTWKCIPYSFDWLVVRLLPRMAVHEKQNLHRQRPGLGIAKSRPRQMVSVEHIIFENNINRFHSACCNDFVLMVVRTEFKFGIHKTTIVGLYKKSRNIWHDNRTWESIPRSIWIRAIYKIATWAALRIHSNNPL